jgi:hypothetical protein
MKKIEDMCLQMYIVYNICKYLNIYCCGSDVVSFFKATWELLITCLLLKV